MRKRTKLIDEERLTMSAAARRLNIHVASIFRWATRGVRNRKLPTVMIGGRRFVLVSDLDEFLADANRDSVSSHVGDKSAEERVDQAEEELSRHGI